MTHMTPTKYIEDKVIDWERVKSLLGLSSHANHWTNFGPVSLLLEKKIHEFLNLDPNLSVIVCSNATLAMNALIDMHNVLNERNLKWVVSSYGFYCTIQGPLYQAHVVDCTPEGLPNLLDLSKLDFDGLLVTNVFGLRENMDDYKNFCKERKKVYVCDSAKAFGGHIRHGANEFISFHHTKPWGFGEGGCVILHKKDEQLFRSLINFGLGLSSHVTRLGTNGKLSDIASAFIIQRIEELPRLESIYREQYKRIARFGEEFGYKLMNQVFDHPGIPPNVPLLRNTPIHEIDNPYLNLRKYYKPLADTPVANHIYNRIINIPCHPGVQNISDKDIKAIFSTLENANPQKVHTI